MATVKAETESKEPLKMKRKPGRPKKLTGEKQITKVDLTKKEDNAVSEQKTEEPVLQSNEQSEEKREEVKVELQEVGQTHSEPEESTEEKEVTVINEKPIEEVKQEVETVVEKEEVDYNLPENVDKLIKFMEETGGSVEDYVTLNKDYSKYDDNLLVREYYKKTRPHLDDDEISFVMEDNFKYDSEVDEERFVRKQKLAYKEEVAKAKNFLEQMKSKYYDEIKLRPSVTNEQKKAMDFFQRYNQEQQQITQKRSDFVNQTKNFFQEQFKGFEFNVGEKAFRYSVSNPSEMINAQTDVSKVINKFMDKNGNVTDMVGYHKAIYAARNADRLAQHFYEQGKADATRDIVSKSKNISNEPKTMNPGETMPNGWKVRAITGSDSSRLKIKKKS